MKKIIFILLLVVCSSLVFSAGTELEINSESKDSVSASSGSLAYMKIMEIRQDPFPANPGEYVDLYLKLDNLGGDIFSPKFDFKLDYPFSLDASSMNKEFSYIESGDKLTLHYRIKIDEDATPGNYEVELRSYSSKDSFFPYFFDISIDDVTTDFDVAVQEINEEGVSLAISNIGKNNANAITISIEEEDGFELLGLSSYIIGNLNSGDYTLLNTLVYPKDISVNKEDLEIKIVYTDTIGSRREISKNIPISLTKQTKKGFYELKSKVDAIEECGGVSSFFLWTTIILIIAIVLLNLNQRKKLKKIHAAE